MGNSVALLTSPPTGSTGAAPSSDFISPLISDFSCCFISDSSSNFISPLSESTGGLLSDANDDRSDYFGSLLIN